MTRTHAKCEHDIRLSFTQQQLIVNTLPWTDERRSWAWWWRGTALTFHPINEATLSQAELVLRWVTFCGQVNHLGM